MESIEVDHEKIDALSLDMIKVLSREFSGGDSGVDHILALVQVLVGQICGVSGFDVDTFRGNYKAILDYQEYYYLAVLGDITDRKGRLTFVKGGEEVKPS